MTAREYILKGLKGDANPNTKKEKASIRLPGAEYIKFSWAENAVDGTKAIRMTLFPRGCGVKTAEGDAFNMQSNAACFEGWAAAIRAYCGNAVILDVEGLKWEENFLKDGKNGHFNRFLYRVLRFSQQYDWFDIAYGNLKDMVKKFEKYLQRNQFVNNSPGKPAHNKALESEVEGAFSDNKTGSAVLWSLLKKENLMPADKNEVFRQFPVGLFEGKKAETTRVFTGGASAIDLWTICGEKDKKGDTLAVMELKAENKMVGAVTEAFFYANYMRDMFVAPISSFQPRSIKEDKRGYMILMNRRKDIERVKAVLLLDKASIHPLFTDKLLDTLNRNSFDNGEPISYCLIPYGLQYQHRGGKKYIVTVSS